MESPYSLRIEQTTRAASRRLTSDEIISVGEDLMSRYNLSGNFHRYIRASNVR